jgi:hypothetical protein
VKCAARSVEGRDPRKSERIGESIGRQFGVRRIDRCDDLDDTSDQKKGASTMPIGDIVFLVLVLLSIGWVAYAAVRSRRGTS